MEEVSGTPIYGLIEITGRARAGNTLDIGMVKDGERVPLGSARALPVSDPFIQKEPSPDGSGLFTFRTKIKIGAGNNWRFDVADAKGSDINVDTLRLTDLHSGKSYKFSSGTVGSGGHALSDVVDLTPDISQQ